MSTEIKLIQADVEKTLAKLNTSIHSLELSLPTDMKGRNRLDAINKLNELNLTFEIVVKSYQTLLLANEELTRQSIESLKETEAMVASGIQLLK